MILASASPRRRELLEACGLSLTIRPADIDESRRSDESPEAYVARLACAKAHAALDAWGALPVGEALLAADTIVHVNGLTLGKPANDDEALAMLRVLSGRTHHVSTGVCVLVGDEGAPREDAFVETTDVTFFELSDVEMAAYVASGEPADKAGAYGIQGAGRLLVREIAGDYSNVVGLPIARVTRALSDLGYADGTLVARALARRGDLAAAS